jgi:hypothetical protein
MVMSDSEGHEHFREEDWIGFASARGDLARRAEVARHLEAGCPECAQTLRLWSAVLSVADQETSIPPRKRPSPLEAAARLRDRMAARVALVFDSLREPQLAGVRTTGASPRQLLYKAGRYTIKVQIEPAASPRGLSIVGQILDEQDPAGVLRDIAVAALRGTRTLDTTLTNQLGEFHLEPDATDKLQLSVDVPEIGTFAVQAPPRPERMKKGTGSKAIGGSGRGTKARPR